MGVSNNRPNVYSRGTGLVVFRVFKALRTGPSENAAYAILKIDKLRAVRTLRYLVQRLILPNLPINLSGLSFRFQSH